MATYIAGEGKQQADSNSCDSSTRWSTYAADVSRRVRSPDDTRVLDFRHIGQMNNLMGDMHVESLAFAKAREVTQQQWQGR